MIKPIETLFGGYRFRSRLEARWAVFFTHCRLRWSYEPEGYDIGNSRWYLPDFLLPDHDVLVEIKPERFDVGQQRLGEYEQIAHDLNIAFVLIDGAPGYHRLRLWHPDLTIDSGTVDFGWHAYKGLTLDVRGAARLKEPHKVIAINDCDSFRFNDCNMLHRAAVTATRTRF